MSVTCPLEGSKTCHIISPTTREQASMKGQAARKRFDSKFNHYTKILTKYNEDASRNGIPTPEEISIIPFIFESAGDLHPKAVDLLERIAERAEDIKKICNENLLLFFLRRLNICLQKTLAQVMNTKVCSLSVHGRMAEDYTFHERYIVDEQILIGAN